MHLNCSSNVKWNPNRLSKFRCIPTSTKIKSNFFSHSKCTDVRLNFPFISVARRMWFKDGNAEWIFFLSFVTTMQTYKWAKNEWIISPDTGNVIASHNSHIHIFASFSHNFPFFHSSIFIYQSSLYLFLNEAFNAEGSDYNLLFTPNNGSLFTRDSFFVVLLIFIFVTKFD